MVERERVRREVAKIMLRALEGTDFVLTGASALIEHSIVHRPTMDVDLFTSGDGDVPVSLIIPSLREALAEHGATMVVGREYESFADGRIMWKGHEIGFDLGVDWRGYPGVMLDIGPVLDVRDSIGSKLSALFSRHEQRDYMDAAAIVLDGRWSPDEILDLWAFHTPSPDHEMLASILDPHCSDFPTRGDFAEYGFAPDVEARMREALAVLRAAALATS